MKKVLAVLFAILLLALSAAGCAAPGGEKGGKLRIVATIFPEYDWVRQILGEEAKNVELTLLLDNGVDLHSFQPTADDIVRISSCDLFLYVGGESDGWVEEVLKNAADRSVRAVNLIETLGDDAKLEESVEGMEEHEEEEEEEYDEHVWLSLRCAAKLCGAIADEIARLDEAHADLYHANAAAYLGRIAQLDEAYRAAVDAAAGRTVLFGSRFPFRYLTDDYGLTYYAAFSGCSAESEASFETVVFLAKKVDECGLSAILQIESADGTLAETIRSATAKRDQKILTMDSLQSTTAKDVSAGADYLSIMEKNLEVLKAALG